jgi:hypothetical protein
VFDFVNRAHPASTEETHDAQLAGDQRTGQSVGSSDSSFDPYRQFPGGQALGGPSSPLRSSPNVRRQHFQ